MRVSSRLSNVTPGLTPLVFLVLVRREILTNSRKKKEVKKIAQNSEQHVVLEAGVLAGKVQKKSQFGLKRHTFRYLLNVSNPEEHAFKSESTCFQIKQLGVLS